MLRFLTGMLCGVFAIGSATWASEAVSDFYGTGLASFTIADDDRLVDDDLEFAGGAIGAGYALSEHWNVEALYQNLDFDGQAGFDQDIFTVNAMNIYRRAERLSPYLLAGIGYASSDFDAGGDDDNLQLQGGVGLLTDIFNDRIALRTEFLARWEDASSSYLDYILNVGVQIGFGGGKAAAATAVASSDSDNDGVPDDRDQCPDTRANAVVDISGCEIDSDNDGVVDGDDRCPGTEPGAMVDASGCELDRDGDGVVDRLDECPDTKPGATVDTRGCEIRDKIELPGVNFETNSANLLSDARSVLNDAAATLKKNPELTVEVEGHTDDVGDAGYNQTLSQNRAEAVRDYLINAGAAPEQLTAVGYGESQPIADNTNPSGQAQNRRVVLRVLSR